MSFSIGDIPEIKWSLLTLAVSVGVTVGLVNYSASYAHQARQDRLNAQRQLNEARDQLTASRSDLENMAAYRQEYQALEAQKVIGDEQRLDWMEGLEKIREEGVVLNLKYNISPQQAYVPNPPLDAGNFALNISPMTLQLDLLHEEQLLHLIAALNSRIPGWFMLERCSLAPANATGDNPGPLKAECAGGWLTMKNRNAP